MRLSAITVTHVSRHPGNLPGLPCTRFQLSFVRTRQGNTTMRSHAFVRVLLLTAMLLAAFAIGERYSASTSAQSREKWEYQILKADRIQQNGAAAFEIKGLGKQGED